MGRILVILGITLVLAGLLMDYGPRVPLGRLPGDIAYRRGNLQVYFPIVTCILLSLVLTLVFWLFGRR